MVICILPIHSDTDVKLSFMVQELGFGLWFKNKVHSQVHATVYSVCENVMFRCSRID